jgi:hypothetical protein
MIQASIPTIPMLVADRRRRKELMCEDHFGRISPVTKLNRYHGLAGFGVAFP